MGEGTEYQFKKQIYKKIFEDFIGVNNAAVAHGGIDVKLYTIRLSYWLFSRIFFSEE